MNNVIINEKGTIQNLLSLNYTDTTKVIEYINNVIHKNEKNLGYNISFELKEYKHTNMFVFEDNNSIGFQSLDELKKAYSIADSERSGANNMGYGIFSPITIDKNNNAMHLFIQTNNYGNFYSMVKYDSDDLKIQTIQGIYDNHEINGIDVHSLENKGGTRSIWITEPNLYVKGKILDKIKNVYDRKNEIFKDVDDLDELFRNLGKRYFHFIQNGIQIKYGNVLIPGIDILQYGFTDLENRFVNKYKIRIDYKDKSKSCFYIKEENDISWKVFVKSKTQPFGKEFERCNTRSQKQEAQLEIYDLEFKPDDNQQSIYQQNNDRKIWVEINNIRIFCEEFVMNQWPKIRVILKLRNDNDNTFDQFITPNPNKSNSKINGELKEYIVNLIKYTANNDFKERLGLTNEKRKSKKNAWIDTFGITDIHTCTNDECENEINPFDFYVNSNDKPVCKNCK